MKLFAFLYGDSMQPTFHNGDLIIYHRYRDMESRARVIPGQIVLYKSAGFDKNGYYNKKPGVYCHRVIDIEYLDGEVYYTIKGDNRKYIEHILFSDIKGRVTSAYRLFRKLDLRDREWTTK